MTIILGDGGSVGKYNPEKRLQHMLEKLKAEDFRITPQRYAVLKALAYRKDHPSAENIHAELTEHHPTMSLATVYKTINLLKKEEEVLELGFSNLGNRYDGRNPHPHPHVICIQCAKILDPTQLDLNKITRNMMKETGFQIVSHRLDFYGICSDCQ